MKLPARLTNGFTLIELVVVMAILGVLMTVALAAINPVGQLKRANDAKRKQDIGQIQRALTLYYQDNNKFPAASGGKIMNGTTALDWGTAWVVNAQTYMPTLPKDPNKGYTYFYDPSADLQSYRLFAHLETSTDSSLCPFLPATSTPDCPGAQTDSAYCKVGSTDPESCNYVVTSPNAPAATQSTPNGLPSRQ